MSRVLIVRLSALGDIVHALPVLFALKRALPSVAVDWLVEENYASLLALVPELDRRIVVRATTGGASDNTMAFSGGLGYARAMSFLRAQGYDAALDLQGLIKSAVWARASGAKRVIGFDRGHLREPYAASLYSETVTPPGAGHVIDKNLAVLRALNVPDLPMELRLQASASTEVTAAITGIGGPGKYIVMNPGAAWPNKRWPTSAFAELAAALSRRNGLRTMVTWGPGDGDAAKDIVEQSNRAATRAPATNVADLAVVMQNAALVISGDTGPLHIAAAMGTPIVGLYGPTWPERNGPWNPRDLVVSRADTCVCHHKRECLRGAPCINDITVREVLAAAERQLYLKR